MKKIIINSDQITFKFDPINIHSYIPWFSIQELISKLTAQIEIKEYVEGYDLIGYVYLNTKDLSDISVSNAKLDEKYCYINEKNADSKPNMIGSGIISYNTILKLQQISIDFTIVYEMYIQNVHKKLEELKTFYIQKFTNEYDKIFNFLQEFNNNTIKLTTQNIEKQQKILENVKDKSVNIQCYLKKPFYNDILNKITYDNLFIPHKNIFTDNSIICVSFIYNSINIECDISYNSYNKLFIAYFYNRTGLKSTMEINVSKENITLFLNKLINKIIEYEINYSIQEKKIIENDEIYNKTKKYLKSFLPEDLIHKRNIEKKTKNPLCGQSTFLLYSYNCIIINNVECLIKLDSNDNVHFNNIVISKDEFISMMKILFKFN